MPVKQARPMTQEEWEEFARKLYGKVLDTLEIVCQHMYGDREYCLEAYKGRSFRELARSLAGLGGRDNITEKDLELLDEMPLDIYSWYDYQLTKDIDSLKVMSREEWRKYADKLLGKVFYQLDHLCYDKYPSSGHEPLDCFASYERLSLGEIAERLEDENGDEEIDITPKDLELLEKMPYDIYEEYNRMLQEGIKEEEKELHEAYCDEMREALEEAIKSNDEELVEDIKKDLEEFGCA